jgi:hypothetical protein
LRHRGLYVLPATCPTRPGDPCKDATKRFERAAAKAAKGFTSFDCKGAWWDGTEVVYDENKCFIVWAKTPGVLAAVDQFHQQAVKEAGESARFLEKGSVAAIFTPGKGKQRGLLSFLKKG